MFTVDDLATLYIYIEYIIPAIIVLTIVGYLIISHYAIKFKIYRINREHDVEKVYSNPYWYAYKCHKCSRLLYEQPSNANVAFTSSDYIIKYSGKCTGISNVDR